MLSAITAWAAVSATAHLMPRQVCIKRLIQEQAQVTADDRSAGQASRPSQMVAADRLQHSPCRTATGLMLAQTVTWRRFFLAQQPVSSTLTGLL